MEGDDKSLERSGATAASGTHERVRQSSAMTAVPSSIGGRYRVLAELGRGGMGVVYHVHDSGSGQELALKQLLVRDDGQASQQAASLFEREYHTLAQLAHPRVIAVHDYGFDPAGPYYTMELLDGGDLKAQAPLAVDQACRLMLELCSSLALLHARRLVHRDISPRNVRCTRDGHAKLIDFGAMVPMGPCTHTVGTPAFIAPEVLHRSNIDARTDLFSLGATLYYTLTGRPPFAARHFADLRDAWLREPAPPSRFAPDVPPALDALCAALLRIDPAQRPRSAFEVMQRLQAIAGSDHSEPIEVRRAYLTAPALIGRDAPLRAFRQRMRRALHGDGGALAFESAPGLGRSRMLDACALEAKTLGAIVLRAAASASAERDFAVAEHLAQQLVQALPETAVVAAREGGVHELLFETGASAQRAPRLRAFASTGLPRAQLQDALDRWLRAVAKTHALLIAIDDVQRVDEPSIALIAGLVLDARELRLLVAITADENAARTHPAYSVLIQRCQRTTLCALSALETEALFTSVFGHVPHLRLLADRVHKVAAGSPRSSLEVAQHLVDHGVIRYEHGQWTLPEELAPSDLPASVTEALAARIDALPRLARRLADAQALLGSRVLRREDYAALAPQAGAAEIDGALLVLLEHEVLQSDGTFYSLSHRALAETLRGLLDEEQKRELHLALFEHAQRGPDSHAYLTVHHLFAAGRDEQALDLLATCPVDDTAKDAAMRSDGVRLAATLEHALALCVRMRRPAREAHELRRRLSTMVMLTDTSLYDRVAPAFLAQLERDTGLADYRALDPALAPAERLQQALTSAITRHAATPEHERGYPLDEALKLLAVFAVVSIVVGSRTCNLRLIASLPGLIEPFVSLSPALHAIWQNLIATDEHYQGRVLQARARWAEVYEQLGRLDGSALQYTDSIRFAIAKGITQIDSRMGRASTLQWAERLDADPMQRVSAMQVRRVVNVMRGDFAAAERYAREAEQLALRASSRDLFEVPWQVELLASVAARDLAGIKRAIDGIAPFAARLPGWVPMLRAAEGHFHLLRGDLVAAAAAFARSIELARADGEQPGIEVWAIAVAGQVVTLTEQGRVDDAIALGTNALAACEEREATVIWHDIACALTLAETRAGRLDAARARIDALIAEQRELEVAGLSLAASYEARAHVAIAARDAEAAAEFAALALRERGGSGTPAAAAHAGRLLATARDAGLDIALATSDFEQAVRKTQRQHAPDPLSLQIAAALEPCSDGPQRAARALALLCEVAQAESGRLYLAGAGGQLSLAASNDDLADGADLGEFARGFLAHQLDEDEMTAGVTEVTHMLTLPGAASFVDARGHEHRVLLLSCRERGSLVYVGVAVLAANRNPRVAPETLAYSTLLAQLLLRAGDCSGAHDAVHTNTRGRS